MVCSHSHLLLHAIKWYIGLWYFPRSWSCFGSQGFFGAPCMRCWKHGRACHVSLWHDLGILRSFVYSEAIHEIDTWEFQKRPSVSPGGKKLHISSHVLQCFVAFLVPKATSDAFLVSFEQFQNNFGRRCRISGGLWTRTLSQVWTCLK